MKMNPRLGLVLVLPFFALACASAANPPTTDEPAATGSAASADEFAEATAETDVLDLISPSEVEGLAIPEYDAKVEEAFDETRPEIDSATIDDETSLPSMGNELTVVVDPEDVNVEGATTLVRSASGALAWYASHKGSRKWEGLCLHAAANSYGLAHAGYPTAYSLWLNRVRKGVAHRNQKAPKGALVFWKTSANGHVGVADGKGGFWSSSVHGAIGHATLPHFQKYLGWAPKPW